MKRAVTTQTTRKSAASSGEGRDERLVADAMSVKERVRARIEACPGPVLLRSDFRQLGSASQVTRALATVIVEKKLVRIGLGLYAKVKRSSATGQLIPAGSLETLSTAALTRLGIEGSPGTAARAYNRGDTTQLPGTYRVHTGARRITRVIEVGGRKLLFEHD